jgi:hypothetical protein
MITILNVECGPIWNFSPYDTVASMVADDNGIESLDELEEDSNMRILLDKLIQLTRIQNAALVDICEQVWRLKSINSIDDRFQSIGLILAE